MNQVFKAMGISKQSFHQYHDRLTKRIEEESYLLLLVDQIRRDHPTMGCRDMYFKLRPGIMGRDLFEEFCRYHGYQSKKTKNFRRTTDSTGVKRFENLSKDFSPTNIDQLWVSDITYYEVEERFFYLTFVLDVYSRRILGWNVADRLTTEKTTLNALNKAIKTRGKDEFEGLIFHSDGGGQYYDKAFLRLTHTCRIRNSMCKNPWENAYAERINGTIKNNYLKHWNIKSLGELIKSVDRAVNLYNTDKPHKSLKRLTPVAFENSIFESGKQTDGEKSATELKTGHLKGQSPLGRRETKPLVRISLKN